MHCVIWGSLLCEPRVLFPHKLHSHSDRKVMIENSSGVVSVENNTVDFWSKESFDH